MGRFDALHAAIHARRTEAGAYYYPDPWWDQEINAITADMTAAIDFVDTDCSDEELYWLSEIIDDVMDKTRNAEFLNCLRRRVQTVQNPQWRQAIQEDIETASAYLS